MRGGGGFAEAAARSAGPVCKVVASRASRAVSKAEIHCASKALHNESENSSAASTVSGVAGSIFRRSRSASSLTKAWREANPKSASKVVPSTVSSRLCHQTCARCSMPGRACRASRNSVTRATEAWADLQSPRTQSKKPISQRWRATSGACGFNASSRSGRSRRREPGRAINAGCGRHPRSVRPARTWERRCQISRHLRQHRKSCHAWCRWVCAAGCRWCTRSCRRV